MSTANYKHIPTKQLKTILNDPYTRGVDGKDYQEAKDQLAQILWEREDRRMQKELKERERQESAYDMAPERIKPFITKTIHVDDIECLEKYGKETKDYWVNEDGTLTVIPDVILPF